MIKQIRHNVFETNSSSTHSLILCSAEEKDLLDKGKMYIIANGIYTEEERIWNAIDLYKHNFPIEGDGMDFYSKNQDLVEDFYTQNNCYTVYTLEEWSDDCEIATASYTTKNGETVIGISKYGYDY